MTIQLPTEVESGILDAVHSGRFASVDDAMTEAASMLISRLNQERAQATPPSASPVNAQKPILERVLERAAAIPDEECDKLPTDLAEQHDHYLYKTPKRPTA